MPRSISTRRRAKLQTLCVIIILIIIVILLVCLIDSRTINYSPAQLRQDPGRLIFVQAIFRHGDRTPAHSYPNDVYRDGNAYVEGWGALTKEGMRRLLLLGRFLRERYIDYIPNIYFPNDVYTLSSDADRCIMSAQSLLAGLYPPSEIQIIEPELGWQPIPVHTSPRHLDIIVAAKRACKVYDEELLQVYASEQVQAITAKSQSLLSKVTNYTGMNVSTVAAAEGLYNTLDIQRSLNLTLPSWADESLMQQLKELAILSLQLFTQTPYMTRIRGGPLLGELHKRMIKHDKGEPGPKLFLVSGHDLTLINLLRAIGFIERKWKPEFAALLLMELHATEKGSVVKLVYSNGFGNSELQELLLKDCGSPCTLKKFIALTRHNIPGDWEAECQRHVTNMTAM